MIVLYCLTGCWHSCCHCWFCCCHCNWQIADFWIDAKVNLNCFGKLLQCGNFVFVCTVYSKINSYFLQNTINSGQNITKKDKNGYMYLKDLQWQRSTFVSISWIENQSQLFLKIILLTSKQYVLSKMFSFLLAFDVLRCIHHLV